MSLILGLGLVIIGLFLAPTSGLSAMSWPAETNTAAVRLTSVDSEFSNKNMSGAFWNPETDTPWLTNNNGRFYALIDDGAGSFQVATNENGDQTKEASK